MTEWRDIPGYEGHYQVSDDGQVKSLARTYVTRGGVTKPIRERILRAAVPPRDPYPRVVLRDPAGHARTRKIHQLVASAFHGPSPFVSAHVCHNDGDSTNNHPDNLRWDTCSENGRDTVRHGRNYNSKKTHCSVGHEYTPENTIWRKPARGRRGDGFRICRACSSEWNRRWYLKKKARAAA